MVQVQTLDEADPAGTQDIKMPAYKVVTNYNNMFSDHPGYPSHSYVAVPNGLKAQTRPLTSGTREQITSSSGLQVTGKDRALFFKRPVLQLSQVMPLPHIRYTREMTMSVEDVAKNEERKKMRQRQYDQIHKRRSTPEVGAVFERTNSSQAQYTTNSARQPRVTFGTQTDFRESETQTLPTSLTSSPVKGELGALSMLKYGRGLPVQTQEDLVFVDKLRENYEKERNLPPKGDPRRPILQRKLIESKYQIEMDLKQTHASKSRHWKVENMKSAVDDWANNSAQQLENRLDRLWKHKQREKDERMKKIRKIHQKEIKALERKCSIKNERLYGRSSDRRRAEFREALDQLMQHEDQTPLLERPHQHFSTSADIQRGRSRPIMATRPRTTGFAEQKLVNINVPHTFPVPLLNKETVKLPNIKATSEEQGTFDQPRKKYAESDQFLETYNGLNALERQTGRQMNSAMLEVTGRSKSVDQVKSSPKDFDPNRRGGASTLQRQDSYVPRNQKFNHLLDTAYQDILVKKTKDQSRGHSRASHALYESFRPLDLMSGPVSDDELLDEEALERKMALERLHAEERGRANQLILQKIEVPEEEVEPNSIPEYSARSESAGKPSEAKVEAFLDEIEGETLGQMLSYLSSELESSEDQQPGAGDDPSERNQNNSERIKRRTEQIDHVFAEITKVTQAAVDRYVDGILLNTIYKKAGQKADVVMQEKVRKLRRSSTSDLGENLYSSMENLMDKGGTGSGNTTDNLKIKRRIKDFQKKHLLAAHEALWGVLGEMKERGEIHKDNKTETEEQIREALKSLMKPEEVEDELRKAIEGLNLEDSSAT